MPTRVPASIRYNNPGAQWPGPVAKEFGSTRSHHISGGNLIAEFPSQQHGAAAHLALLDRRYTGMTLTDAIRKWTGGTSDPSGYISSVSKATGIKPSEKITRDIFAKPETAIPFARAMAGEEAGTSSPITGDDWLAGYNMAFPNSSGPTIELGSAPARPTGNVLEINAGDTSQDPGGINVGGNIELGNNEPLGSDLRTEFTGPEYATPAYQPTGDQFDEVSGNVYASNPFDEWWKAAPEGPGTISSGDGGSIWSGNDSLGSFVGDTSLGTDLSADLGSMNFGDRPAIDAASPEEMAFNQPPPPGPLEETNEWTTSPGDRRFLPGSEPAEQPAGRGGDISSFGTFGNPLTLGSFFGNSLESMRFGTDRYQPNVFTGAEATGGYNSSLGTYDSFDADGNLIRTPGPPPAGSPWDTGGRENATNPPGSGDFNAWPRGELLSPQPPAGMKIIGHDTRNGQPIYQDANGNKFVNPGTGQRVNPAFSDPDSYYADTVFNYGTGHRNALHEAESFSGSKNQGAEQMGRIRQTTTDAGHNQFGWEPGAMMFMDDEGGFDRRSVSRPRGTGSLRGWAGLVTSAAGRQSVATPLTGGR